MAAWAAAGIGLGLLIPSLLVMWPSKRSTSVRSVATLTLTYLLLVVAIVLPQGLTPMTWIAFTGLVVLPLPVAWLASRGARSIDSSAPAKSVLGATTLVVVAGMCAVLLVAGAQALSLVGRVNPVAATVSVGIVSVLVALGGGSGAANRAAGWVTVTLAVVAALFLAGGLYLGRGADLAEPITSVPGLPALAVVSLIVAVLALATVDPALKGAVRLATKRQMTLATALAAAVVLIGGFGLLLVFGGVIVAPSLPFFTVPANIPAAPVALAVTMAIITVWITVALIALLASTATSEAADSHGSGRTRTVSAVGGAAILVAILPIHSSHVFATTALVAVLGLFTALVLAQRAPSTSANGDV